MLPHIKHLKSLASDAEATHKINEIVDAMNVLISERNGENKEQLDGNDYPGVVLTINP
jgi:hypothetical protein